MKSEQILGPKEDIKAALAALGIKEGDIPQKDKVVKEKQFLFDYFEAPVEGSSPFYRGSDSKWFIRQEALDLIWEKCSKPLLCKANPVKLCALCPPFEAKALSREIVCVEDFARYYNKEKITILPKDGLFIHYFELSFKYDPAKRKDILARIEKEAPSKLGGKGDYYHFQAECFKYIASCHDNMGGLFTTCYKHSTKESLEKIGQNIVLNGLNMIKEEGAGLSLCFWPGNNVMGVPLNMGKFFSMHYAPLEIGFKVLHSKHLEEYLDDEKLWHSIRYV